MILFCKINYMQWAQGKVPSPHSQVLMPGKQGVERGLALLLDLKTHIRGLGSSCWCYNLELNGSVRHPTQGRSGSTSKHRPFTLVNLGSLCQWTNSQLWEADFYWLCQLLFLAIWLPVEFGQWEVLAEDSKDGRRETSWVMHGLTVAAFLYQRL